MTEQNLNTEPSNSTKPVLPAVLIDEIINYIEEMEETRDKEWGYCRSVEELIKDNCMPELYAKMLALKNSR